MKKFMFKPAKRLVFILLFAISSALTFKLLAWHSESMATGFGYGDNHALITMDALDAAPGSGQYPDLIKFYNEIWDATSGVLDDVGPSPYPSAHSVGWDASFSKEALLSKIILPPNLPPVK